MDKKKQEKEKAEALKEELKPFKKEKPITSKGQLKRITGVKSVDSEGCRWFDRWVEQLVREHSYPPQLKSDDFYSLLGRYFDGKLIMTILERARTEYRRAFPLCEPVDDSEDDLAWLIETIRLDPNALALLPPNYLCN